MRRLVILIFFAAFLSVGVGVVLSAENFPPPEFVETNHQIPTHTEPDPRSDAYEYLDVLVLIVALGLSAYLVLKKRSRNWILCLMLFSLVYFGFLRKGCICPIGAIQNVTLSIFDSGYAIPVTALLFFVLPIVFTLFFGRTFCAAVCPLGAIQDLVALRPRSIPTWLEGGLRLLAYVYLCGAVLFAATGSAFIICRYDPFVSFFRLSGSVNMVVVGICLLGLGVFIGRPYCRFLCPYGLILRQVSRISKRHVTITPDECIKCRLCEDSCPYGAIREPSGQWSREYYIQSKKRLGTMIVLVPVLILLGALGGWLLKGATSQVHSRVRLADRIYLEEAGKIEGTIDASDAFWSTGVKPETLYTEAAGIVKSFGQGGLIVGGFLGLVVGVKLVGRSIKRRRTDYEADRSSCVACGRCFEFCPREHIRLKKIQEAVGKT
jgi:polyferredoxin